MKRTLFSKKFGFTILFTSLFALNSNAQCSIATGPTNDCGYGDAIDLLTIGGTTVTNAGCSGTGTGYTLFASPVWNLYADTTYNLNANVGGGMYDQGLAIWIDANNDGVLDASEQFFNAPAASLTHTGTITIPTSFPGLVYDTPVRMRVMCAYNLDGIPAANACVSNQGTYGETEDYSVIFPSVITDDVEATSILSPNDSDCGSSTSEVWVRVTNNTSVDQVDVPLTVNLSGLVTATYNDTIPSLSGLSFEDVMVGTIDSDAGGTLNVQFYTSLSTDEDNTNDTLEVVITINGNSYFTQTLDECDGYSITVGTNTYTTTGIYNDTLVNAVGCDSVVTTDLTINTIDNTVDASAMPTLTANQAGATYQWLDCDNAYAPIAGATDQTFEPTVDGNYAVEVTIGACSDTSDCSTVAGVGTSEKLSESISIYPNPTSGLTTITLENTEVVTYTVTTIEGRIITTNQTETGTFTVDLSNESNGIYLLIINISGQTNNYKIIKQ